MHKNKLVVPSVEQPENKSPEPSERKSAKVKAKDYKPPFTASITTGKTTLAHKATITARDKAFQVRGKDSTYRTFLIKVLDFRQDYKYT